MAQVSPRIHCCGSPLMTSKRHCGPLLRSLCSALGLGESHCPGAPLTCPSLSRVCSTHWMHLIHRSTQACHAHSCLCPCSSLQSLECCFRPQCSSPGGRLLTHRPFQSQLSSCSSVQAPRGRLACSSSYSTPSTPACTPSSWQSPWGSTVLRAAISPPDSKLLPGQGLGVGHHCPFTLLLALAWHTLGLSTCC